MQTLVPIWFEYHFWLQVWVTHLQELQGKESINLLLPSLARKTKVYIAIYWMVWCCVNIWDLEIKQLFGHGGRVNQNSLESHPLQCDFSTPFFERWEIFFHHLDLGWFSSERRSKKCQCATLRLNLCSSNFCSFGTLPWDYHVRKPV